MNFKLDAYSVNLKERNDRHVHILGEFENRNEFVLKIKRVKRNKNGAFGLWKNIVSIIKKAKSNCKQFIILIEDDHQFTKKYNKNNLFDLIEEAKQYNVDVLLIWT
jgi:hypothetical protein